MNASFTSGMNYAPTAAATTNSLHRSASDHQMHRSSSQHRIMCCRTNDGGSEDDFASKLNITLDLVKLEHLVCYSIPTAAAATKTASRRRNLCLAGQRRFTGLASRCAATANTNNGDSDLLLSVADWLGDIILACSSSLSSHLLQQIHSFIGLIRHWNGEYESSKRSYVTAAWIAQRSSPSQVSSNQQSQHHHNHQHHHSLTASHSNTSLSTQQHHTHQHAKKAPLNKTCSQKGMEPSTSTSSAASDTGTSTSASSLRDHHANPIKNNNNNDSSNSRHNKNGGTMRTRLEHALSVFHFHHHDSHNNSINGDEGSGARANVRRGSRNSMIVS